MEQMQIPSFRFTTPFEVSIERKGDMEEVHLDGFISTTDQDLVNDIVTKKCLEEMKDQILKRNLKLDIEHEAFRGKTSEEQEINKAKIPVGRMYDASIEPMGKNRWGLRVKSILNSYHNRFNEIKGSVMNRFLDAYSIAFIPTKTSHKDINGKNLRFLDGVSLLNVALTGNPINTTAQNNDVFLKAINSVEDYQREKKSNPEVEVQLEVKSDHNHKSDIKLNKKEEKDMTEGEKEASETETQEAETQTEESSGDKEAKDVEKETPDPADESEESDSDSETKSRIDKLEKEIKDLKAVLRKPVLKSKVEQQDKSDNFKESKSINPLDVIA